MDRTGEQNNTQPYVMVKKTDGEYVKLLDITEFTENYSNIVPNEGELGQGIKYHLAPTDIVGEFTFTMKYPKVMRCKSRKRYVKLLMSMGLDRNMANLVSVFLREVTKACGFPFSYQARWNRDYLVYWLQKGVDADVH